MTTYVLGAGASHDAGYPLAAKMGAELFSWMKNSPHPEDSYAGHYPATARLFEEWFPNIENVEDLITKIEGQIERLENGTREERTKRTILANEYGVLRNALRAWFAEIQRGRALLSSAYRDFAMNIVAPGDCIITFNYDVSLERELKAAGKFEVGDGYGFVIESLPQKSSTKVLKLHGSTSWLAPLFGGRNSGFFQFEPGNTLGSRPVIPRNELSFLGYREAIDPEFTKGGAALPVMIFPARSKEFYFSPNTGEEYAQFWNELWRQAAIELRSAARVIICGYSLNPVDERARDLLLGSPKKNVEITVGSGGNTDQIVGEYCGAGYAAVAAEEVFFEKWVRSAISAPAIR